jgi:hypothetical protein
MSIKTDEIQKSRAYTYGYNHAVKSFHNNQYKRNSKIIEYDAGFNDGLREKMRKTIKNKPQLFHNSVSRHNKNRITLIISGGSVQDVIRENIDCELIIHDYDIEGIDAETNEYCYKDENGEWYQEIYLK